MLIDKLLKSLITFHNKECALLKTEKENISQFCCRIFGIISLILMGIFGLLMFFAIPFFNIQFLLMYGISFLLFLSLAVLFFRTYKSQKSNYLPLVYVFCIYLYIFGILISINSAHGSHAATSIICLQVIFPLLIFDRSLHVNVLSIVIYLIHSVLSYHFKEWGDFTLDVFNGGAFTLLGIIIGEYERYIKLSNFEKDRILIHQKNTDMLTELPNRRMLFERLTDIQENHGRLSGLFMIDIDHFKIFNDTLGHQKGDMCLQTLGKFFAEFGKENDFEFYRYGGEEFCALTVKDNYEELQNHAEKLCRAVESLALPFEQNKGGVVTISIGFAHIIIAKTTK